jgi:hypothetical protein
MAPIEITFARGPNVAARRGTAVDANHQSLYIIGSVLSIQFEARNRTD